MPDPLITSLLPDANQVLTVTDFTRRVKKLLETHLPEAWIRGEISNFRRQTSGHCYFSLKDANSQVAAVVFREQASGFRVAWRDGLQIVAYGKVSVYEPRGNYQLIIRFAIEAGAGRLQEEFERLKRKLADEGLFDPARKKAIPPLPQTVGFITSPTGAAIRDFISILRRRGWRGRLVVLPARVQGDEAAPEIINMLHLAENLGVFDLLVIGRGGGSLEDLQPFNDERLARAVAACPIPTISAVGHEIDFTLCDFAADLRAETPSAAAELITSRFLECLEQLEQAATGLVKNSLLRFEMAGNHLDLLKSRLRAVSPESRLESARLRLDDFANRLPAALRQSVSGRRQNLQNLAARFQAISPQSRIKLASQQIGSLAKRLANASPRKILKRGYVLVKDEEGHLVTRKAGVEKGRMLRNEFYDGELPVQVTA